ncbi:hypothetical protein D3C73_1387410 [compost metagenome]
MEIRLDHYQVGTFLQPLAYRHARGYATFTGCIRACYDYALAQLHAARYRCRPIPVFLGLLSFMYGAVKCVHIDMQHNPAAGGIVFIDIARHFQDRPLF